MNLRFLTLMVGLAAGLISRTASAQVVAPSQGGEVNVISVTANTIEVSFGRSGNGQGRLIGIAVAGPGGRPVSLAATDGQFYTASNAFGKGSLLSKGYVVYNGNGHSATITNLQPTITILRIRNIILTVPLLLITSMGVACRPLPVVHRCWLQHLCQLS